MNWCPTLSIVATLLVAASFTMQPTISATGKSAPHKKALIIGVSGYQQGRKGDLTELNTNPDVEAISKALQIEKFGFKPADIRTLTKPNQTTRESILAALKQLASETNAGDLIYIHFSGHGSQIPDDDSQEETDGLDETLVPSDYDPKSEASRIASQIRDDEVGEIVDAILAKKPLLLTSSFDCCCSGGNTRGLELKRGFPWQGAMPDRGTTSGADNTFADRDEANFVAIYAARPSQSAWETVDDKGHPMGLLSYALSKHLEAADNKTTYKDVLDNISLTFMEKNRTDQNPQIEGKLDNVIMSGAVLKAEPLIKVEMVDNNVVLNAGDLAGVTKDSVYELYPANTKSTASVKPFGKFFVESTDFTSAVLKPVDGKSLPKNVLLARAKEVTHRYGDAQISLSLEGFGQADSERLAEVIEKDGNGFVKIARAGVTPDIRLIASDTIGTRTSSSKTLSAKLERRNGSVVNETLFDLSVENRDASVKKLVALAKDELRWNHLMKLKNEDSDRSVDVEFRLVPLIGVQTNARNQITTKATGAGEPLTGAISLPNNQFFAFEARCKPGSKRAYLTVFDLTPDGQISIMYPLKSKSGVHDNYIEPDGNWHRLEPGYHKAGKPAGDLFKLVATEVWSDFTPITSEGRTKNARGAASPIVNLFLATNETRRLATLCDVAPTGWCTAKIALKNVTDEPAK